MSSRTTRGRSRSQSHGIGKEKMTVANVNKRSAMTKNSKQNSKKSKKADHKKQNQSDNAMNIDGGDTQPCNSPQELSQNNDSVKEVEFREGDQMVSMYMDK